MALVTVQRSPSPTHAPQDVEDAATPDKRKSHRSPRNLKKLVKTVNTIRFVNRLRFSESYFTIKGAALILPKADKLPHSKKRAKLKSSVQVTDIQAHLQRMFHELRPDDTIQVAIKLETKTDLSRYLAIVVTEGKDSKQEGVIIGFHCTDDITCLGLVLPVYQNTDIALDGDGGFRILTEERPHIFNPISIQAMWSAIMSLNKVCAAAKQNNQIPNGPTHSWLSHYTDKLTTDLAMLNEWDMLDDLMVTRAQSPGMLLDEDISSVERQIRANLRELLAGADLEDVTCYMMRMELEKRLNRPLKEYRSFIDQEMMLIIRQFDSASEIFDFVYLGSEWNACNLQELQANGVGYILNVTREIDNFFPGSLKYMNIRLYDNETADLMKYWENTHGFICKARENNSKILVHCKMGVSRSASTVIAFAMKEYKWSLEYAMDFVRSKRSVIKPNDAFMQQLQTYEGILMASMHRSRFNKETDVQQTKPDQQGQDEAVDRDSKNNPNLSSSSGAALSDLDDSSDSEEQNTESSSTTSYSLDEDSDTLSLPADDGHVIGLHYHKLNETDSCNVVPVPEEKSHKHKPSSPTSTMDSNASSHANLSTCHTTEQTITASQGAVDDVSVCYGLVRKTKEKIVGGQTQVVQSCSQENTIPVPPGTVRKVLGEIEHKSAEEGVLARSASLRLIRRKTYDEADSMHRSASLRLKRASIGTKRPSSLVTHSTGVADNKEQNMHDSLTSTQNTKQNTKQTPGEVVQFSIGGSAIGNNSDSSLEDGLQHGLAKTSVPPPTAYTPYAKSCQFTDQSLGQVTATSRTDHILRVSSKPYFLMSDDENRSNCSSPLPVKALVGAFEDIGVAKRHLTRPLTIHVDSFSSDMFANTELRSAQKSSMKRTQSLQVFTPTPEPKPAKKADKRFNISTVSTPAGQHLRPYWRIKMDNAKKLIHSFSSAAVSSKDST